MTEKSKRKKIFIDIGAKQRKIDPEQIAKALGAEPIDVASQKNSNIINSLARYLYIKSKIKKEKNKR